METNVSEKWVKIILSLVLEHWKFSLPSSGEAGPDVVFRCSKQLGHGIGVQAKLKALLLQYVRDAEEQDEK